MCRQLLGNLYQHLVGVLDIFNITIFCRHAIAAIHFNANLSPEKRMKDGVEQYNIVYPKLMNGEDVVRTVPVKQNFGKFSKHMTSMLHFINLLNQKRYSIKL